jgi:hypothetical protein
MRKIYLFILVGLLVQCNSENDSFPQKNCTVLKVPAEEGFYAVTYNDNGKVSKLQFLNEAEEVIEGDYQEFIYEAGKLTRIDWYKADVKAGYYQFEYSETTISQIDYSIYEGELGKNYSWVYTLDSKERVTRVDKYDYDDMHEGYEAYEYNDKGNIVRLIFESFIDEENVGEKAYMLEFDNNPNPYYIMGINTWEDDFFNFDSQSANNMIRAKDETGTTVFAASYNYNSNGYPLSKKGNAAYKFEYLCEQ